MVARGAREALAHEFEVAEAGGADVVFVITETDEIADGIAGQAHIASGKSGGFELVAVVVPVEFARPEAFAP